MKRGLMRFVAVAGAAAAILGAHSASAGVEGCKVKIARTGAVEVSAMNVEAGAVWGPSSETIGFSFFNLASCYDAANKKLSGCNIGDPTTQAGQTPPAGCVLYIGDGSGDPPCQAYIKKGCAVLSAGTDGAVPINQERARAGGVTPGDAAGFPVTIDRGGSYRLTGNLDVRGEATPQDVTAILIAANDVTLDLNGFAVLGPVSGCPLSCSPSGGSGSGILSTSNRVTITDGTVRGMGASGLSVGEDARIQGVHTNNNGSTGIGTASSAIVTRCTASNNGGNGISMAWGAVDACTTFYNLGDGINVGGTSAVTGNTAVANRGSGISGTHACVITGNIAMTNQNSGIYAGVGSVVSNNVARLNGQYGMLLDRSGYAGNTLRENSLGQVSGGIPLGSNVCGDALCL
jgi:hypothetical protein